MNFFIKSIILLFLILTTMNSKTLEKLSLRLQWKHQFEFAGFYIAKEHGYYKEAGIDVELFEYDSNVDIVDEVTSGEKDFAIWGSGVIEKAMNGEPLVLLANYFKRSPLAIITHSDIILPSELKGKKLMIPKSDFESANYHQIFKLFNLKKEDINLIPSSFDIQDFIDKKVDAYSSFLTNEPYILRSKGIRHNIIDPNNYGIELYDVNLFSSKEFVKNNKQLVEKFIELSNKGWEYALKNKEETVDLILKKYNTQNKTKEHLLFEAKETERMMLTNIYPIGSIDIEKIEKMGNFFTSRGMTTPFYDYQSIIFPKLEVKVNLTKQELNYIEKNKTIPISVMKDFSPFSFEVNNKYRGFVNDLLNLIETKTGLKFQRVTGQWIESLDRFKTGETKVIADISHKKERESFTLFTEPYYEIPTLIFARDDFKEYKGIESFKGKNVGIQKNIFYQKELSQIEGIQLDINESIEQMAKNLSFGKTDFAIMNLLTMNYYIKKNALTNIRAIDELILPTVNKEDLRFGVSHNEPLLFSILQKALDEITYEEFRALTNKWIGLNAKDSLTNKDISQKEDMPFFTKKENEYLNSKKELKLCVSPKWMPIEGINDNQEHTGIGLDIKNLISEQIGKNISFVKTNTWEESLEKIKDNSCSILSLSKKTKNREKYLNFTKTLFNVPYVVVSKKDKFFIDSFDEIKNNKFAVIKASATEENLKEFYPNSEIIRVKNITEGLNLVELGEVYGYIDATATIGYEIDKNELYDLKIIGKLPIGYDLSYAVVKDEPILFSIIEKVVNNISRDERNRIYRKWIAIEHKKVTDYSLIWKIILIFLFFILLISYWNIKTVKAKKEAEKANKLLKIAKLEIEKKNNILEKLATTDKLTGIYNRTKIDELLDFEINRSKRFQCQFGFLILDIDYFKIVNDTYGHLVGDKVLVEFTNLMKNSKRDTDYLGRWGGEEFIIIVPQTNEKNLLEFAQKLRQKIESYNFEIVGSKTASFGLSLFKEGDEKTSLIKRADDALYKAKKSGRNRVFIL